MNFRYLYFFLLFFYFFSCQNESDKRKAESIKDIKKKELIFSNIEKAWVFNAKPINATAEANFVSWKEWRAFMTELEQKPKKSIGAFQKKTAELSKKVSSLEVFIPAEFDKPQIKSRIAILVSNVKMLDLYIHLKDIPDQKVVGLIPEINLQLVALQKQMDKIMVKSKIPLEDGESELLKMLDTARAIPTVPLDPNMPRVE